MTEAFQQLGLTSHGSKEEVRAAYLSKMKQLHPDLNPGGQTTELAARITVAYHDLMQASQQAKLLPVPYWMKASAFHQQSCMSGQTESEVPSW